ncbi:hypothetical protein [Geodermatophilus sp. DSM 45219]|uniref:hypothetical protein n=1 Tax=Geodermatophilus sp. DSM 45219 TaxID=1881103 RepID=UPI00088D7AA0|nr:hypothetical protein [Geodermatophilus sp. DSM 45219]SDO05990.1 hypothetical protein SAMN05428965_2629 [Geodermatophilus sp. DSM 45219]
MANDRALLPSPPHTTDDLTLSGLLDVLDRAEPLPVRAGHRPRRAVVHRAAVARPRAAVRPVPVPAQRPRPVTPVPAPAAVPGWTAPAPAPAPRPGLRTRVRRLVRRLAMWGAGPDGAHLAWGRPAPAAPAQRPDGPVLLTELPSTPTIQPAAPSPAAALRPARSPRPAGSPRVPVVAPLARQLPAPRPAPAPRTAQGSRQPGAARASAPARSRGDPRPPPARGQPPG